MAGAYLFAAMPRFATVVFQPGELGLQFGLDGNKVIRVFAGQAHNAGVEPGWTISQPADPKVLREAINGYNAYQVVFQIDDRSMAQKWQEFQNGGAWVYNKQNGLVAFYNVEPRRFDPELARWVSFEEMKQALFHAGWTEEQFADRWHSFEMADGFPDSAHAQILSHPHHGWDPAYCEGGNVKGDVYGNVKVFNTSGTINGAKAVYYAQIKFRVENAERQRRGEALLPEPTQWDPKDQENKESKQVQELQMADMQELLQNLGYGTHPILGGVRWGGPNHLGRLGTY